jgi:peptide/nickel transport system substrate-binding protein
MLSKKWALLALLVFVGSMVLSACDGGEEKVVEVTRVVTEKETVVETVVETVKETIVEEKTVTETVKETIIETVVVEVEPEEEPAPESDRHGGWLDMVVYLEEPRADAAVTRLDVGEMDVYAYTVADPEVYRRVQGMDNIKYTFSYGSHTSLLMNVAEFDPDLGLNPFSSAKFREAVHWLVDREYIAGEIYGGLAVPRYTPLNTVFPDYALVADVARKLEAKYAHNPEKAQEVITEEMENMGAEFVDGQWTFNGEPVVLKFLIRTEDQRRDIGDYVANLYEELGFTAERLYKTSAEAAPLWQGDPYAAEWHLYTAGWIANFVNRDLASNFEFFFTPRGYPLPLWQAYAPVEEFDTCADELNRSVFSTLEERRELMARCLELSMENASEVWVVDRVSFTPRRPETLVTGDLAAAVAGSRMNPYTMRFKDQEGGAMTVGMPSILTQPWNPIGGSNWVYDAAVQRAVQDYGMQQDPYTGLRYPQRIERAEVFVQTGLPVGRGGESEDWLTLEFVDEIVVPDDAWADWDAANQVFITAGERFTETETALQKTVIYYPSELFDTAWHDGSNFSVADVVMYMIMYFDPGKPDSPMFDTSAQGTVAAALQAFKGIRIVSQDPLVIETYTDNYALEAELVDQISNATWYPTGANSYPYGTAAWHSLAVGLMAEEAGDTAFTSAKSDELEVERTNYIGGPSLDILAGYMVSATAENYVPFAPTLSQFVSEEEAAQRWSNLNEWYAKRGHFWIGTGPYYLEGVFFLEGTVIAQHNPNYIDRSDRWSGFAMPKIAEVEVDGPGRVDIGAEATYDVYIEFQGEPYALDDISRVSYLLFDASGEMVSSGEAEAVEDGLYQVVLGGDETSQLQTGASKLEVVVVSKAVAIPSFVAFEFVTQ